MPNMSRRSLENHHDRVTSMIRRDPAQASFFRSRYESLSALRKRAVDSYYDSQDETDISQYGKNGGSFYAATKTKSWLRRLITVITTFFSTVYYRTTNVFRRKHVDSVYYSRYGQEQRGRKLDIEHKIHAIDINNSLFLSHRFIQQNLAWHFEQRLDSLLLHLLGNFVGAVPWFVATAIIECVWWQEERIFDWFADSVAVTSVGR